MRIWAPASLIGCWAFVQGLSTPPTNAYRAIIDERARTENFPRYDIDYLVMINTKGSSDYPTNRFASATERNAEIGRSYRYIPSSGKRPHPGTRSRHKADRRGDLR